MTLKICRVCFEQGDNLKDLGNGSDSYGHKLASCVPEIDVYIICNPSICEACLSMVEVAYALREMCIKNEDSFKINRGFNAKIGKCEVAEEDASNEVVPELVTVVCESLGKDDEHNAIFKENKSLGSANPNYEFMDCGDLRSKNVAEENSAGNSDDELINSLNEMCADIANFEERNAVPREEVRSNLLFSEDDGKQSFELDLNPLNLLKEDETNKSRGNHAKAGGCKMVACEVCKESHDEAFIETHMKVHDVQKDTYDCGQCNKTFSDTCELEAHTLVHLKNFCDVCGKVLETKKDLAAHKSAHGTSCCGEQFETGSLLQMHTYQKHGMSCGICNRSWSGFNTLFLHLLEHTGEEKLDCRICKKSFATKTIKLNHQCTASQDSEKKRTNQTTDKMRKYRCKHCLTQCYSRKSYWKHMRRHSDLTCYQCGSFFTSQAELDKHNLIEHALDEQDKNREDTSECQVCRDGFENPELLKQHIMDYHLAKQPSIELVDCQKQTPAVGENHQASPTQQQNTLSCYACHTTYTTFTSYLRHMKITHSKCTVCNIRLHDVRNVIDHVLQHYKTDSNNHTTQNIDKPPGNWLSVTNVHVYCELCGMEFESQHEYNTHMDGSHSKHYPYSTKLYTCRVCYQVFDTKLELRLHNATHLSCVVCGKTFVEESNLEKHMEFYHDGRRETRASKDSSLAKSSVLRRTLTGKQVAVRKCKICGKSFKRSVFLMKHIYAMHSRCTIESDVGHDSHDENVAPVNAPVLRLNHCDICRQQFDTLVELKMHVSVHI